MKILLTRYGLIVQYRWGDYMRLGWSKQGNSILYYINKTIRVDGKNKSIVIKRRGSEGYICETYGVSNAEAWAY